MSRLQSVNLEVSNPLGSEMMDDVNIFAKPFVDEWMQKIKNKLDKMWEMTRLHEKRQNANKRRNSLSVKTSEVTVNPDASSTITPTTDISGNLLHSATFTGIVSTIVPSNPSSELDTTSYTYNINNTNIIKIIII